MKRILCLLLCVILLTGCASGKKAYQPTGDALSGDDKPVENPNQEQKEQSLVLAYYADRTMNPYTATDFTNRALFPLIYQGLFTTGRDYRAEPILCKNYSVSQDMKSYTFYIEDATFSDGSPLTMQDVLTSLETARKSDVYKGRFHNVVEMSLQPDNGLLVQLSTPYEDLPILLDVPIVKESQQEEDRPLGTGPYVLETTSMSACLRRRSNWWCDPKMVITASTISLHAAESVTNIRDEFEFGDLSLVCADPGSDRYADYRCDFELWDCENGIFMYLAACQNSTVFADPAVRKALTYAIDRDLLVKEFYRGFARSATLPASPLSPYYNIALAEKYQYHSKKFAQAIKDAGLEGSVVKLLVNREDSLRARTAREIGDMLEKGGLVVEMKELAGSEYRYALESWDYDLYLGQTKLSPNMDLSAFFSAYGSLSQGGINNVEAYALCQRSLENHGNYYTLHQSVMENGLLCPVLFRSYAVYATRGLLTDLTPARDNVFFYSLGKTMEKALLKE